MMCSLCNTETPHFKGLLDHYKECHPNILKRYQITNYSVKQVVISKAESPEQLCLLSGWDINRCKVKEMV